ncbi:Hypothetical Protein OBI_RACECAR_65 [Arthrobacter phage Racecar]|nr:hypothetical protein PBI_RACECAR_147 [Arthrobacter phage Racecar]QFG12821.1 hypothetical protein PBI_MIMI_144 [Arthrobacter phage Mimi]
MNFKVYRHNYGTTTVMNAHPQVEFTRTHVIFNEQRDGKLLVAFKSEDVVRIEREKSGN